MTVKTVAWMVFVAVVGAAVMTYISLGDKPSTQHKPMVLTAVPTPPIKSMSPEKTPSSLTKISGVIQLNFRKLVHESRDDWELAHTLLPFAKAGNADAQYYLYELLQRCIMDNKMYFRRKGKPLNLDEGVQFAAQRHLSVDVAQSVYERCHSFLDHNAAELGSPEEWLARATDSGQPVAQATTASRIMLQRTLHNFELAGATKNPEALAAVSEKNEPHELLRAAIQSKDPEVLFKIGEQQSVLNPTSDKLKVNQFAWWLVACQRGLDCSADADWVKAACMNDVRCTFGDDPGELMRSFSGDEWPQVQSLAGEISDKLDADKWDELLPSA